MIWMWNGDGKWEEDGEALKCRISSKGKTKVTNFSDKSDVSTNHLVTAVLKTTEKNQHTLAMSLLAK